MYRRRLWAAAAAACLLTFLLIVLTPLAALAAEVAAVGDKAVVVPYGDWIVAGGQTLTSVLVPILVMIISTAVYQVAPWARLFLSQAMIERMVTNAVGYALNAIAGAAKDKVLDVPTGSAVISKAVQRVVDQAPAWVLKAAGGPAGISEKVFRMLHLEATATAANTLAPAQAALPTRS